MSNQRQKTAQAISKLMPNIIQGAHLGVLTSRMITQTQFLLLIAIHARGACQMTSLAEHMKVQMPTVTGIVNRLVKAKYLYRIVNPQDRRQVVVDLTPQGRVFLKQFQGIITKRWTQVLKALDEKELDHFYLIIEKLNKSLRSRE